MSKSEHSDYAIKMRFEWDKTKRVKTIGLVLSARMPFYEPDYIILTKQQTDKKIKELVDDIDKIFWDKAPDIYYIRDNIEKEEFVLKMNSKWSKEEELSYLNKKLGSIASGMVCRGII